MTYLSSLPPLDVLDLVKAGKVTAQEALELASCNRWLSRTPLWMRLKIIWLLKAMLLLFALPVVAQVGDVTLEWDRPTQAQGWTTNSGFKLYGSPTLSIPSTNTWQLLTNLPALKTNTTVRIVAGEYFFAMIHTNEWGPSTFSSVVSLPPLPASPNLSIKAAR